MPVDVRRVREPIGEVADWVDVVVVVAEVEVLVEPTREREESWDMGVCGVGGLLEELVVEMLDLVEAIDGRLSFRGGSGAVARVAILIPRLVLVLAGMKRVVWLLVAGMAIR